MNKVRDSFIFYRSFYEAVQELDEKDKIATYDAIISYALNRVEPDVQGAAKAIFKMAKPQIDANQKRFLDGCEGAEHGAKGGAPKGNKNAAKKQPHNNP